MNWNSLICLEWFIGVDYLFHNLIFKTCVKVFRSKFFINLGVVNLLIYGLQYKSTGDRYPGLITSNMKFMDENCMLICGFPRIYPLCYSEFSVTCYIIAAKTSMEICNRCRERGIHFLRGLLSWSKYYLNIKSIYNLVRLKKTYGDVQHRSKRRSASIMRDRYRNAVNFA